MTEAVPTLALDPSESLTSRLNMIKTETVRWSIVKMHMKDTVYGTGQWSLLLRIVSVVFFWLSLIRIGQMITGHHTARSFVVGLGLVFATSFLSPDIFLMTFVMWLAVCLLAMFQVRGFVSWHYSQDLTGVPPKIMDRIELLNSVRLRWSIARFLDDPVLIVHDDISLDLHRCCVGGWDTGIPEIDDI